ncbi:MAG: hypothetical protein ABSG70_04315 [Terriglobales bacterium]|jgi:hypothetical protein
MEQSVLTRAVEKLVSAGERAGMSMEDMIRVLQAGVSVETLLDLITRNLPIAEQQRSSTLEQHQLSN